MSKTPSNGRLGKLKVGESIEFRALTEIVVGPVVAFVLHIFHHDFTAGVLAVLGPALGVTRFLILKQIKEEMADVHALAKVVDLQQQVDIQQLSDTIRVYLEVTEEEFRKVKTQIIQEAVAKLQRLARLKASDELQTGEYYSWLLPMLEQANKGSRIWAISLMLDCEWNESPYEERFLALNVDAVKKGVDVERLFVVEKDKISQFLTNKGVRAHMDNRKDNLKAYVIVKEKLIESDPALLRDIGDGFIAFDDRVALVDKSSGFGIRGYVTMNAGEIARLRKIFEQLKIHGWRLDEDASKHLEQGATTPTA